ncbi:hypothetical protein [Telluribacter sp. SYSU D00476]|uniref:hypothetical protein n=1 Tax=Telluribacter sp. SYSU D00476 TaxID=2811430 RepID=UPI001FF1EB59|nr:hypothetical protein [Telluribacter sp. SYSU D00476]
MKTCLRTLLVACCVTLGSLNAYGQTPPQAAPFLTYHLVNVPPLAPDDAYVVPMRKMGLNRSSYSVLLKVRLPGDSVYYTIPGVLPTGDSFGFRMKTGKGRSSDTLYVIRRGGESPVQLEEIYVLAFHPIDRLVSTYPKRDFDELIVTSYYDAHTRRSTSRKTGDALYYEKKSSDLFPTLTLFPTKQSQMISFQE